MAKPTAPPLTRPRSATPPPTPAPTGEAKRQERARSVTPAAPTEVDQADTKPNPNAGPPRFSARDADRPVPISGEVRVEGRNEDKAYAPAVRKATTAVLEAYTDDARAAIAEYESRMLGEKDVIRIGRLHYEIGRLLETVVGDMVKAGAHYDKALTALPDHLPTVVAARRVRLRLGQFDKALDLFDREIRACSDRDRAAALFAEALDPDDRLLLILRLDREMSWNDIADVYADEREGDDGDRRRTAAKLRKRFERIKARVAELMRADPGDR